MMNIRRMQGFTLVEVMVALVIFGLGFTAVVMMTTGSAGSNATARAISGSAEKAAEQIELLTSLPYEDPLLQDDAVNIGLAFIRNPLPSVAAIAAGVYDSPNPVARPADYQVTSPDGSYTTYWNVAEDTPVPGTKTIMVIVTSTGLGPQKTVVLQHIIPERT